VVMLVFSSSAFQDMVSAGSAAEVEFSVSQCSALARASDFVQASHDIGAKRGLVMKRITDALVANKWSVEDVERFVWEVNSMWGKKINPKDVEGDCLLRDGKYERGEIVKYHNVVTEG
jgi:hypothetical protein